MTEFEGQVLADLHVLKAQMEQIMGIGQPGRLHALEHRLSTLERGMQRMRGVTAALGVMLTFGHMVLAWVTGGHR